MTTRRRWPDEVRQRCFELWSGRGNRTASRVARLYREDLPDDVPGPPAVTIRRWAAQEDWQSWADGEVPPLRSKDLQQWQTMWFRHVVRQMATALRVQTDVLLGRFDGDSAAGAESLAKAAASMEGVLAHPGVRALLWIGPSGGDASPVSLARRERQAWARFQQRAIRH